MFSLFSSFSDIKNAASIEIPTTAKGEAFGFSSLEQLLFSVMVLASSIADSLQSKNWFSAITGIVSFVSNAALVSNLNIIKDEFLDLSDEEKELLKSNLSERFDIANDDFEEKVESAINFLINVSDVAKGVVFVIFQFKGLFDLFKKELSDQTAKVASVLK